MVRTVQLIIILIPALLFAWLLWLDIDPDGILEVRYEMGDISPYVNRLLPDDRVSGVASYSDGDSYVTIVEDPVYMSVHTPQTEYDEIEIEVKFQNFGQPIFEIGALQDIFSGALDLSPLYSLWIDNTDWQRLEDGGVTLFARYSDVPSMEAFFEHLPDRSRIATYHYDLEDPYRLRYYSPLGYAQTIDASLRGYHKYVTYLKGETFYLEASVMDMNRNIGGDDIIVRVWNEAGEPVLEEKLEDDGNTTTNQISSTRLLRIEQVSLPEGVYTVELSGTSDIFWRSLTTTQRYVSFVNRLYIGDDVGYLADARSTIFHTNAKHLTLETYHADATQNITIGSEDVAIPESHQKIYHTVEDAGVALGYTPRGDVKIIGDGKFAFSKSAYFDPDPVQLGSYTDFDALGVDYLLTTYKSPIIYEDWLGGVARYWLSEVVDDEGNITFALSAPGLSELGQTVDVHAITVRFLKEPMDASEIWQALRERLPFGL